MSNSVQMPALGESVTEGTVTRWLKSVGEEIEVDEPLLEVSTDKVDTEIPSPYAGVVEKILADEDDVVEVGGDLAYIGDGSGSDSADSAEAEDSSDEASAESAEESESAPAEESESAPAEESEETPSDSGDESGAEAPASSGSEGEGTEITMPALGESVTEGTVTRWLKDVGEEVELDEPLLEVSTDKVDTEVPSPVAGTVQAHLAEEDETVEVGEPLARVGSGAPASSDSGSDDSGSAEDESSDSAEEAPTQEPAEEEAPAQEPAEEEAPAKEEKSAPAEEAPKQETPDSAASKQAEQKTEGSSSAPAAADTVGENAAYVTPLVRRLARDEGVDLSSVTGTGVGGRIRKQDVVAAAADRSSGSSESGAPAAGGANAPFKLEIPEEAAKLRGTTEKASRIRQTIAKRMSESLDVSAQLTQVVEVDMTRVVKLRKANKEAFQSKHGSKLTYLPFFGKAVVEALQQHPKVNAQYDLEAQEITYFDHEHLAIAVDTPRGLLVPVIKDAGDLSIAGISKAIDDVADRTRNNKIMPDELSGGTFTITNIGSVGALFDTPIINQPQMGILGTGTIVRRPIVVKTADGEESIAIRDMVYLPLTYNHQLVDGADAGRFLQTIKARLEEGNFESDLDL
ncbi:MAG: 2-oxoglutarate dehydrogenase, E2 component, dihydrolipoamide succinyltransferase [Brevibacterium sp.]|uniref:2-oxoglutarate dehydrogenase, E2 component, dihydrolipoamide succinyltransferase n=1 Tax=Brevibacterium sp. TaxID=1701 RepID=UPI002649197B|nr:2-oxoglutarate dehydrogenase, E2 component, dihydrolipoamide succinyltransferase [Brevibacterium sp.]MDN5833657.1 2-oxoglutarate dehydrogenase, E2 component, dihydrolipoamide succinyltransferase [Brevibacterium sp.]MDN5876380.1 2-oxoglutarate dehydrogenase, E2 component, dihydrolipoamide succinyltransferase [Brevibacterium sp.]MDN5909852.1 2-oxoglutarate dehydrogenase, E2 component, dihydrolipoamide succinyltransferase [Brevibacterium sp.]MDN6176061.1 2-oxoglutarate dehydrogenase, E2 compone